MKSREVPTGAGGITYNDSLLLLMKQLLPNGLLGVAIAGLLAAFMAGMAANISAFNTVMSYDIWQTYIQKDKPDHYYTDLRARRDRGRDRARDRDVVLREPVPEHDDLPADAVRVLQRAAVRDVHPRHVLEADDRDRGLDRTGRPARLAAVLVAFLSEDAFGSASTGVLHLGGQGASFAGGGSGVRRRHRRQRGRHLCHRNPGRSRSCAGWSTR